MVPQQYKGGKTSGCYRKGKTHWEGCQIFQEEVYCQGSGKRSLQGFDLGTYSEPDRCKARFTWLAQILPCCSYCSLWGFGWGPVGGVRTARQGVEFHQSKSAKTSKVGIFHSYMANMLSDTLSRNARRYLTSTVNKFIKDIGLDMGVQLVIFAGHKAEDDTIHRIK